MGATLVEVQRLLAVAHRDEASIGAKTSVLSRARSGAASTTRTGSSPMRPQLAPRRGCGTRRAVPHRAAASGAGALPRRPEPAAGPRRAPSGDARARPSAPAHEDAVWGDAGRAAVQPQPEGKPIGDHGEIGVGQDEERVVAGQLERRRCERGGAGGEHGAPGFGRAGQDDPLDACRERGAMLEFLAYAALALAALPTVLTPGLRMAGRPAEGSGAAASAPEEPACAAPSFVSPHLSRRHLDFVPARRA